MEKRWDLERNVVLGQLVSRDCPLGFHELLIENNAAVRGVFLKLLRGVKRRHGFHVQPDGQLEFVTASCTFNRLTQRLFFNIPREQELSIRHLEKDASQSGFGI